jgi:predicted lipid-binding transport protein (Tim44 family)
MAERPSEEARIPVAARRPGRRELPPAGRRVGAAPDAGLALIAITAMLAVAGSLVGGVLGARMAGALVGGFVGLIAGFAGVYVRYRDL